MSAPATAPVRQGRPSSAALLAGQLRYATVALWRTRVVLIFTFALPLVWLLVIGALAGNDTLDEATGLRVMQFATPSAIAMGVLYAAFPTVAIGMAAARESGVLKRLRGSPLPPWIHLSGRIGGAVVFALAAVAAALAVGIAGFGVQVVWHTAAATVVTLIVAMACFAAVGLAIAALSRTETFASAASIGSAVLLTFISGLYNVGGTLPGWLEAVADAFPLKPFAELLQHQFDPFATGSGWSWGRLAVLVAWGLVGALVAVAFSRGETRRPATGRRGTPSGAPALPAGTAAARIEGRPPSSSSMVLGQARAANRSAWRDGGSVFFAVLMPLGVYAFAVGTSGDAAADVRGVPLAAFYAASMIVWGAGVAAFMNLPEAVAGARDRGVLKRLRGTPLQPWQYLAGRVVGALWLAVVIGVLILGVSVAFFDVTVTPAGLLLGLPVLLFGTATLAACGFALAAFVPNARAVGAVGLIVLLPLAFFSDIFVVGGPDWMTTVGRLFPLLHFQHALSAALDPAGASVAWGSLGVLAVWAVAAAAVAIRFFRWSPRPAGKT